MIQKILRLFFVMYLTLCSHLLLAEEKAMNITIEINGEKTIQAQLDSNQTAKDFYSLLPLTLELRDFAGTEKASDALPRKLDTTNAVDGHKPSAGELAIYSPWNNLAIFYKDDKYAEGLIPIGRLDADETAFNIPGSVIVDITVAHD